MVPPRGNLPHLHATFHNNSLNLNPCVARTTESQLVSLTHGLSGRPWHFLVQLQLGSRPPEKAFADSSCFPPRVLATFTPAPGSLYPSC